MRTLLAALIVAATAGCNLDSICDVHATRCDGGFAQECIKTGSGFGVGPIDQKSTYQRSTPTYYWESTNCGSPELCVTGSTGRAMCVLSPDSSRCSAPDASTACDEASTVECSSGFVVEGRSCSTCQRDGGDCGGGLGDSRDQRQPCASGLSCHGSSSSGVLRCSAECSCPDGVTCPACARFHRRAAGYASTLVISCHAGFCLE